MKKVLILTSSGGGGTLAASNAIEDYLKNDYEITTLHIFNDLLKPIDICSIITFKKYSCEDLYNLFIPKKSFRMLTLLYYCGRWYIQFKRKAIRAIIHDYLIKNRPSLIISVVPVINNIILSIAQELDIPFLLIPTDLDAHMYMLNIYKPTYQHFHIALAFHDKKLIKPLEKSLIPTHQITVIGSALKSDFFVKKDISLLKKEFNIPENRSVVMVLMGAQGSHEIEKYIMQLIKIKHPLHLIICTGKTGKQISHLSFPKNISLSVIEFTSRIADLMALSDIIFTKSGSLSVCEAIYMETPLILDATSTILPWEKFNHEFIKTHQFGTSIKRYADIASLISLLLSDTQLLNLYKNNLAQLRKENIEVELCKCVKKMISE